MEDNHITRFAATTYRAKGQVFGIKKADRRYHMYVLGKTGVGKSTLLKTLMYQDLLFGEGFALFDPHGDLADAVAQRIPEDRQGEVHYLSPKGGWHFNPLRGIPKSELPRAAAGMVEVFKKLWPDDWGPRLEHVLRNALYTLIATPESSLADLKRLFFSEEYRKRAVGNVQNPEVLSFWNEEFGRFSARMQALVVAPILNKLGAFLTDPTLRQILTGGKANTFDPRRVLDDGHILLVNLAKGIMGEGPAQLLGSLLVSTLSLAAFGRAEVPEEKRRDFYVYLDEFQNFGTRALAGMLSELRKYRLALVLANQYLSQLDPVVRDAVLGNVGTMVAFRLGAADATLISREMMPLYDPEDFVNLPNFEIYLRLMIDSQVSKAFSAKTLLRGGVRQSPAASNVLKKAL